MAKGQVFHSVGKRKTAIARVYMQNGSGAIKVNQRPVEEYFPTNYKEVVSKAFEVVEVKDKYDVNINVKGGGVSAQADAIMYGISKALLLVSEKNRAPLKKALLLRRDARIVERKKYGHKKARKSFQFSKR